MARTTEQFVIDGVGYWVTKLGTTKGVPLGHRLLKAIGPVVVGFIEKLPKDANVTDEQLAGVVVEAMERLTTELLTDLAAAYVESCAYQDASAPSPLPLNLVYDDHFAGRYGSWLRWFIACSRVNFAGFFSSSGSSTTGASSVGAPTASPTPTP